MVPLPLAPVYTGELEISSLRPTRLHIVEKLVFMVEAPESSFINGLEE